MRLTAAERRTWKRCSGWKKLHGSDAVTAAPVPWIVYNVTNTAYIRSAVQVHTSMLNLQRVDTYYYPVGWKVTLWFNVVIHSRCVVFASTEAGFNVYPENLILFEWGIIDSCSVLESHYWVYCFVTDMYLSSVLIRWRVWLHRCDNGDLKEVA